MRIILLVIVFLFCECAMAQPINFEEGIDRYAPEEVEKNGFSGDLTIASDYVENGISLTNNNPALQGKLTYSYNHFYITSFISNVDLNNDGNGRVEWVPSIGYVDKFSNGIGYDIGLFRDMYPWAEGLDYNGIFLEVTYKIFYLETVYSGDYYHSHKNGAYYAGGIDYEIPPAAIGNIQGVGVTASIGYSDLPAVVGPKYFDFSVGVSKRIGKHLQLKLVETATDGRANQSPVDRSHLIGYITFYF